MIPFRPAPVTRVQVTFSNAVGAAASPVELSVAGRTGTLHWDARPATFEPAMALDLTLDGMPALVTFDSDPVTTLIDLPVAAAEFAGLPSSFQASFLTQAMGDVIDRVSAHTGLSVDARGTILAERIGSAPLLSDPASVELAWRITGENGQTWLRGALRLSPNVAQRIVDMAVAQTAVDAHGLAVNRLSVEARAEIGRTSLSVAELGGIEPGDVVLVGRHRWDEEIVTLTISSNLRYVAHVDDADLTIIAREETGTLTDEIDEPANDGAISDIDEVSLPVTFDLGRLELAIGELRRVSEGYIFNLQNPLDGAVSLRVNGKLIGRGELVDIEGNLGVRVIEIMPTDHG